MDLLTRPGPASNGTPDVPAPSPGGWAGSAGVAAAATTSVAVAGLLLIAFALGLGRFAKLVVPPPHWRPIVFLSPLERPG